MTLRLFYLGAALDFVIIESLGTSQCVLIGGDPSIDPTGIWADLPQSHSWEWTIPLATELILCSCGVVALRVVPMEILM
jgi:hypothetical protein